MRLCSHCAGPLEEDRSVCSRCSGLIPVATSSDRSHPGPSEESGENEPHREIDWLRRPKVRELEKPSWRKQLVEVTALVVFTVVLVGGGILVFRHSFSKDGGIVSFFTAFALALLCIVPAVLFALFAAVAMGAVGVLVEALLAPLFNYYSGNKMPSFPPSVLAKTDALGSKLSPGAEDLHITQQPSAPMQADIQQLDGERNEPLS